MDLNCPICDHVSRLTLRLPEVDIYRCPDCDHCFSDPDSIVNPEEYQENYFEAEHQNWFEHQNIDLFSAIYDSISTKGPGLSVLDIGCGRGDLLRYLHRRDSSYSLVGIDQVNNRDEEGITYIQGDALEYRSDRLFDAVVTLATIEHVQDVKRFTEMIRDNCQPDAVIVVMTINDRSILYQTARFLRTFGIDSPANRLYSPHHLNHFNISSTRRLLSTQGFKIHKTLFHNVSLKAIDLPPGNFLKSGIFRLGVWGTFLLGAYTNRTYLQTVFCSL